MKMRGMHSQGGFTLLEILTAFTVVSILAVMAVPAYLDYKVRAKVSEGIIVAKPAILAMTQHYQLSGSWPTNNVEAGLPPPIRFKTQYVSTVSVGGNGPSPQIFIIYDIPELGADNTLIFFPEVAAGSSGVSWHCTRGNLLEKFRPSECRA